MHVAGVPGLPYQNVLILEGWHGAWLAVWVYVQELRLLRFAGDPFWNPCCRFAAGPFLGHFDWPWEVLAVSREGGEKGKRWGKATGQKPRMETKQLGKCEVEGGD